VSGVIPIPVSVTRTTTSGPDRDAAAASVPQMGEPQLQLLRRVGFVDPRSLDDYIANRGYRALAAALDMGPDETIREVTESKLLGRGGAAFPTGRKWAAVAARREQPHYVVCNADESEPGTFKDRVLMEHDPFALVEAMTIEAFATGALKGYVYIRGEYPLAESRVSRAIETAREATTSPARTSPSTSRSGAVPGRTSAARRRRCSSPSRASAASLATSPRSRSRSACSESRRPSTTWRPSSMSSQFSRTDPAAAPVSPRLARKDRAGRSSSACPATSVGRACTRFRSERRSGS